MTREETINIVKYYRDLPIREDDKKALEMAIKALEQEPYEDAVSRRAVEKITWEEPSYSDALNVLTEVRDKVRALPPVTPTHTETVTEFADRCRECGREKVLDKIRAEIIEEKDFAYADDDYRYGMKRCVEIIDRYREESEE